MRKLLTATILSTAVAGMIFGGDTMWAQPAPEKKEQPVNEGASVPVKAVVLYSSGVGYFEHYGLVKGAGSTELRWEPPVPSARS